MTDQAESSTASMLHRDEDALSKALRIENTLSIDDIAHLHCVQPPYHFAPSSPGSSNTAVFSSREESTVTKPTTVEPQQPTSIPVDKGKGKAVTFYSSSLSGTNGSASEAEVERGDTRRHNLSAMGQWADDGIAITSTLKGGARAKERRKRLAQERQKKLEVVLTQAKDQDTPPIQEHDQATVTAIYQDEQDSTHLRPCVTKPVKDPLDVAERGQVAVHNLDMKLSRKRLAAIWGLGGLMVLTLAVAGFGAHVAGKHRIGCIKGIIFAATLSTAGFIILAMLVARRVVLEALLAGLLMLVVGFSLMAQLNDFM